MDRVWKLIEQEEQRQQETLTLIPSENHSSEAVRQAVASVLADKYAEGYPGKRYYQGNKIIDEIEQLAVERAKKLFNVEHVNVQPYSGSPANSAVLLGLVEPGEKIMGMKLSGGGHLTHGHKVSLSGRWFPSVQYDVDENGWIDYEGMERVATAERPKLIIAGATAYPRIIDWERFGRVAQKCGAMVLADVSHLAGLIAGGVHPSPVEWVDVVMTTTHKTLRGPRGAMLMVTERGLKRDGELAKKIDRAVFPGLQGGPHENVVAAVAVALGEADTVEFKEYAAQVVRNAKALAQTLLEAGLKLTTGGTENHLMVVDLQETGKTGKEVAEKLEEVGIIVNANAIPHDPNPPTNPSGVRLGTPAVTTRGMREAEMEKLGKLMEAVIRKGDEQEVMKEVAVQVKKMTEEFRLGDKKKNY